MNDKFYECPGCGHKMTNTEKKCPYCGTSNPIYIDPEEEARKAAAEASERAAANAAAIHEEERKHHISVPIVILLFIFCWPLAIVYVIVKSIA